MRRGMVSFGAMLGILGSLIASGCGGNASSSIVVAIASPTSAPTIEQGQTIDVMASVSSSNMNMASQGVTWTLSGSGCTGTACGSLTNQTATNVTYNAPASVASTTVVSVTATSVANPLKSAAIKITVAAITVTISNKVTQLAAGTLNFSTFYAQFTATVQNDPTNSGVTWSLTANGAACSPGCGTLSYANLYGVAYTPPPNVPAAPENMPTITATSLASPARSDSDTFTLFDGTTACGTGGNESLLNGQYAIMIQGWIGSGTPAPLLFGASFGADGTGKITEGADQFNPFLNNSRSGFSLVPSASSYSVGPDHRGCLKLTDQFDVTYTFQFSLGGIAGGIASKGDIILFNQQSATPERGSGILRRQDPTAFSLNALASNYALEAGGWENSKGPLTHFALVGSFTQSGGNVSNPSFDANDGGTMSSFVAPGLTSFGSIQPISTVTGMAYATLNVPGVAPGTVNLTVYVISPSELFFVSNDLGGLQSGAVVSGRAIAAPGSFSATSVLPNYIFRFTGSASGVATVSVGLASFSGGISGTVSGNMGQYAGGVATNQGLTGIYAFTGLSGRLAVTGASPATSPLCYLTNPIDGVSAVCLSTDASASAGVFDTQPAATYSDSSLSGNFFFGSNEPADNPIPDLSGVATISSGNLTATVDTSAPSGLTLGAPFNAAVSINADGSGNLGTNTVGVTNGTEFYFINEANGAPAEVEVLEQ